MLRLLFYLVMMVVQTASIFAQRNVKIATIGAAPSTSNTKDPQKLVEMSIEFWKGRLQQVLPSKPDLIVLAEACDRPIGLSQEEQFAYFRQRKTQVQDFFSTVAKNNRCYIAFGTKWEAEKNIWRNSIVLLDRSGNVAGVYHKNYPTIEEMEAGITAGEEAPVFTCDFGTVAGAICYDLNFNELRDRYAKQKPDIILFSSVYHGGLEQNNWAYSCRSYFVSAVSDKRVPSEIRNPLGEVVASTTNYFDFAIATINLDYRLAHLDYNWEKLDSLKKKYGNAVLIHDPGRIGSVLISSVNPTMPVEKMIKEFKIELLDDYFNRAKNFRQKNIEKSKL